MHIFAAQLLVLAFKARGILAKLHAGYLNYVAANRYVVLFILYNVLKALVQGRITEN